MSIRQVGHVLVYPPRGRLLFATDFHGQLEDFRRVVELYRRRRDAGEDVYLLFAGDFVHGPAYAREDFPEHLGDFHEDDAPRILEELEPLLAGDARVRSLLGNHEHAHVGGPATFKFHKRGQNDVTALEARLGPDRTARARALFRAFSLAALTPAGVLFLHAAPRVLHAGFAEVAAAVLDGHSHRRILDIYEVPIVGELLWAKSAEPAVAGRFLERMTFEGLRPRVAVYGHDIIPQGVDRVADNQLIVSTSFGLARANKTLCEIDLAATYATVDDLRPGVELYPLWGPP